MPGKDNLGHPYPLPSDPLRVAGDMQALAESIGIADLYPDFATMEAALPNRPIGALAATISPPTTWMWQGEAAWGADTEPPQWVPQSGQVPVLGMHKTSLQSVPTNVWTDVPWQSFHVNRFFNFPAPVTDIHVPFPGVYHIQVGLNWGVGAGERAGRLIDARNGYAIFQGAGNASLVSGWGASTNFGGLLNALPVHAFRVQALTGNAPNNIDLYSAGGSLGSFIQINWVGAW